MVGPRLLLALPLLLALTGGCLDAEADAAGKFAYFDWGTSAKECTNGVCTYGSNRFTDSAEVRCGPNPALSWDANSWVHGSVLIEVFGPDGQKMAEHTVASNGHGSEPVPGPAGTWTLQGTTRDANGSMQARLTCT